MNTLFRILALSLLLGTATRGIAADAPKEASPELKWAAAVDSNAPFAFYDKNNRLTGFEYEIITAVARHMGRDPKFVQNSWDGLIPGLGRGLYDCVICGIEITAEKDRRSSSATRTTSPSSSLSWQRVPLP